MLIKGFLSYKNRPTYLFTVINMQIRCSDFNSCIRFPGQCLGKLKLGLASQPGKQHPINQVGSGRRALTCLYIQTD